MSSENESRRNFIRQSIRRLARIGMEAAGQPVGAVDANAAAQAPAVAEDVPPAPDDEAAPELPAVSSRPPNPIWLNQHESMDYQLLGSTNFMVSRMAMGCARLTPETAEIAEYALNYGVNFFLAGPNWGASEEALGAVQGRMRDRAWIATMTPPMGRALAGVGAGEIDQAAGRLIAASIDASLAKLKTDHIDCYLLQSVDDPILFRLPEVGEALARAKEAGKIGHAGFSTVRNIRNVVSGALESDLFDLMILPLNPLNRSTMGPLLDRARLKGVGVLAMMTTIAIPPEAIEHNFDFCELPNELDAWQMTYQYMMRHTAAAGILADISTHDRVMGDLAMGGWRPTAFQSNELDTIVYEELWPVCAACGAQRNISDAALEAAYAARASRYDIATGQAPDPRAEYEFLTVCENCEAKV